MNCPTNPTPEQPQTVFRTPNAYCPACKLGTQHTSMDWAYHPFAGHGFTKEMGWSHPELTIKGTC